MPQAAKEPQEDLERAEVSEDSRRRVLYACKKLNSLLQSKLGDPTAWGKVKIECHISGGQLASVNVVDDVNYK